MRQPYTSESVHFQPFMNQTFTWDTEITPPLQALRQSPPTQRQTHSGIPAPLAGELRRRLISRENQPLPIQNVALAGLALQKYYPLPPVFSNNTD